MSSENVSKVTYVSAACNQTGNIADWGKNNLICYGSSNAVLIYDLKVGGGKVTYTLHGHKKRVNAVSWITGSNCEHELVSVSSDGNAIVWSLHEDAWTSVVLKGHTEVVNVVDALYKNVKTMHAVVATASSDSNVRIWTRINNEEQFICSQIIDYGYSLCVSLRLTMLSKLNTLFMACASDKSNIDLYLDKNNSLECVKTLRGHEDWVRGLDFAVNDIEGYIILASSSQDAFIRLWKIFPLSGIENAETYINKGDIIINNEPYMVKLESILSGHENWVYELNWSSNGTKLLSSSLDKSMVIWELNAETNLWLEIMRVGEVGGNTLGFYGGKFGPDDTKIMAHSYHGAFHIWNLNEENHMWEPQVTVGGHFGEVVDLAWDPQGEFVMSVAYDQTTRIHAPWKKSKDDEVTWHEIGRPQVHGYDMSCLAILSRYKFASGAEEKIIRTFEAPENFVNNFKQICGVIDNTEYFAPKGASVPSLGLSNKAVYENDNSDKAKIKNSKDMYAEESFFTSIDLIEPPTEETLIQNTLWPEIQKLYGHGYEVFALASSSDGKLLASSCKSSTLEHANILLWETETWQIIQKLYSHTLTIAQISFSPDCQHLLSVSRDRRWTLYTKNKETNSFELAATTDKKTGIHTRIIWTCSWSHDSKYFITGSRDGKVVVWTDIDLNGGPELDKVIIEENEIKQVIQQGINNVGAIEEINNVGAIEEINNVGVIDEINNVGAIEEINNVGVIDVVVIEEEIFEDALDDEEMIDEGIEELLEDAQVWNPNLDEETIDEGVVVEDSEFDALSDFPIEIEYIGPILPQDLAQNQVAEYVVANMENPEVKEVVNEKDVIEGEEKEVLVEKTCLKQYGAASKILQLKGESITAVDFAPGFVGTDYLVAVGLDSGCIHLYKWNHRGFKQVLKLDNQTAHHLTVKKLKFSPTFGETGCKTVDKNILQLASCSSDHSVRIYSFDISKF